MTKVNLEKPAQKLSERQLNMRVLGHIRTRQIHYKEKDLDSNELKKVLAKECECTEAEIGRALDRLELMGEISFS